MRFGIRSVLHAEGNALRQRVVGAQNLVTTRRTVENRFLIGPIEAIDGIPVVDIKLVLRQSDDF